MKKLCLFGILINCSLFSNAQSKISYGIGAGINMATANYSYPYMGFGQLGKNGFMGYGFADVPLYKQFSVQPEIGLYHFGTSAEGSYQKPDYYKQTISLNYLTISILPKFRIKYSSWSLFAGPSLGFKTSDKNILVNTNLNFSTASRLAFPTYSSSCFFGVAGLGYSFPFGLGLSARYMHGFSSILESGPLKEGSAHQQSFNFSFNYTFR